MEHMYMTIGIQNEIEEGNIIFNDLIKNIIRFEGLDFGELCREDEDLQLYYDKEFGELAPMLMGVYRANDNKKYWVTSNYNEETTCRDITVLLPEEY